MYIDYTLKSQNETFLMNQEWSGIFIAKHGAIHIEYIHWMYIEYTLKYQNETFLINQDWSGIFIAKHDAILIESSTLNVLYWK